jgi:hypothetical protein
MSKTAATSVAAFASVLHARVASLLIFHNMTVLVAYDRNLLQIRNELKEPLLDAGTICL